MDSLSVHNRIVGCLVGGALGDAIGASFEGQSPSADFRIPPNLYVTDDTQLTLATCEALIETPSANPEAIAKRFVTWFRQRRLHGVGASTWKALTELEAGGHWALVGAVGERAAGNGAAMRIAPLAFVLDPHIASDRQTLRDICRITHRHDEAYLGALAIVLAIRHAASGGSFHDRFLGDLVAALPDSRVRDRLSDVHHSLPSLEAYARRFGCSGYVVDSVPLAIVAAMHATSALETFRQIVQCGGDTDTNASLFGQIYGAAGGPAGLPMELFPRIDDVSAVRDTVEAFAQMVCAHKKGNR